MQQMSPRQMAEQETAPSNPFAQPVQPAPPAYGGGGLDLDNKPADQGEPVPLFKLDGHWYTIPAKPRAGFALKYLYAMKQGISPDAAAADLLLGLIGEAAYSALSTSDKVDLEDFVKIMELVKTKVLGPALEALGN